MAITIKRRVEALFRSMVEPGSRGFDAIDVDGSLR
jgi:hypothetical protein